MTKNKEVFGNIIMFLFWLPFFASSIDSFIDLTQLTNKIIQLVWLISFICVFKLITLRCNPPIINSGLFFTFFMMFYGVIHLMFGETLQSFDRLVPKSEYLVGIISSLLPVFFIYYYSLKGVVTENLIRKWSLLFLFTVIIAYLNSVVKMQAMTEADQFTNNIGYVILRSIPFLLFWYKRPILQYVLFVLLGILILESLKRGPILIWLILLVIFVYTTYKRIKTERALKKILLFILPVVLLGFAMHYFNNTLIYNEGFMNRFMATLEGDDSGRGEIYNSILQVFYFHSGLLQTLFGHGADATIRLFATHAHNDWLEILINQGVAGVIIYIIYYLSFYRQLKSAKDIFGKTLLLNVLVIIVITSLFSMSYMAYDCSVHILLGYSIYRASKIFG